MTRVQRTHSRIAHVRELQKRSWNGRDVKHENDMSCCHKSCPSWLEMFIELFICSSAATMAKTKSKRTKKEKNQSSPCHLQFEGPPQPQLECSVQSNRVNDTTVMHRITPQDDRYKLYLFKNTPEQRILHLDTPRSAG
jgi:hypothetical protein